MKPVRVLALLVPLVAWAASVAAGPADSLLRLVPADTGVTFVVEDLRGHSRAALESPLTRELERIPAARSWRDSPGYRNLRAALRRIETAVGVDLPTLRDELLGKAVVLTLRLPADSRPDEARGLLLLEAPNPELLRRLVASLGDVARAGGELKNTSERRRGELVYHSRTFRDETRPDEFHASLPGNVLAWSNSEALLTEALDLHEKATGGLLADAGFRSTRQRLPEPAPASLFVSPRFLERLLAEGLRAPRNPRDERAAALSSRFLAATRYIGLALGWREGPLLQVECVLDPSRLDSRLAAWAARLDPVDPRLLRVPPSALALARAHLDGPALLALIRALVPDEEQIKLDNLLVALRGVLLGLDPLDEVAPRLGPGIALHLEPGDDSRPGSPFRPVGVLSVQLPKSPEGARVQAALENALRTLLALAALEPKNGDGLRVESRKFGDVAVTFLAGHNPVAFATWESRLVLSSSAEAVSRAVAAQTGAQASRGRFESLRARAFPDATSFACVDLRAACDLAESRRAAVIAFLANRPNASDADPTRDLDRALALGRLLEAAYVAGRLDPRLESASLTLGLVARHRLSDDRRMP